MRVNIKYVLIAKQLQSGKYHLYLRVTYRRKPKYIGEGIYLDLEQWNDKKQEIIKHDNKKTLNLKLRRRLAKAQEIVDLFELNNQSFDFQLFKSKYLNEEKKGLIADSIFDKENKCKPSTARKFRQLRNLINKYKPDAVWQDIDNYWLNGFERFLKDRKNVDITIKTRIVSLKTVYNDYQREYKININDNPFLHYKFKKVKVTPKAKYLELEELLLFKSYQPKTERQRWAKNLFLFSLYCRGMNFTDMSLLKWDVVKNGYFSYRRSKTDFKFKITINAEIQNILNWAKGRGVENFVFDVLSIASLESEEKIEERINRQVDLMNKTLFKICKSAGIDKKITTYSARHTFATQLHFNGVSTEKISNLLGHSELRTTKSYLSNFKEDDLAKVANKITDIEKGEAR